MDFDNVYHIIISRYVYEIFICPNEQILNFYVSTNSILRFQERHFGEEEVGVGLGKKIYS